MRAQHLRGVRFAPQVMHPGDFPVAAGGLLILREGFETGAIQRLILIDLVFGEVAIRRRQDGLQPQRRVGMETAELGGQRVHLIEVVEAARALHQVIQALGVRFGGGDLERRKILVGDGVLLRGVVSHADADARQIALGAAELRDQSFKLLAGAHGLAGIEQLDRASQHGGGQRGRILFAEIGLELLDFRGGKSGFGRQRESVVDALVVDGGADVIARAGERRGHGEIALGLREHRVVFA